MSQNIIMPKLGMTMTEGTVEEWFVAEGDDVNEGDSIATISSEKLTQDIEAPATGTLLKSRFKQEKMLKLKVFLESLVMQTKLQIIAQVQLSQQMKLQIHQNMISMRRQRRQQRRCSILFNRKSTADVENHHNNTRVSLFHHLHAIWLKTKR